MAEPINPIPNPEAIKPKQLIIGETPVYFTTPQTIDGNTIEHFIINDSDTRASAITGIGTATILMKEPSRKQGERGLLIDKPLLYTNKMDPVDWDKVSGIRYTDANNEIHDISKDQLLLEKPELVNMDERSPAEQDLASPETPPVDILEAATKQKETPALARAVLETLKEDPNTITIVGLKAYEVRARDLAARKMQTLVTPSQIDMSEAQSKVYEKSKEAVKKLNTLGRTIWKQSIGGIYFQERARQYYLEMLKAAETPFAEEAIKMAETRAKATYDKLLSDKNFLSKAGTKAIEWAKDALGMRTMIEKFALQEMADMKTAGEIKGIESFDRESKAVRLRFSQDMDKADSFVRTSLGEKLTILDPSDETHKPLVDGIKKLMKEYATGKIIDKKTFDEKAKVFFQTTLKDARPDVFAEAELYSSSMFEAAETLRNKYSHEQRVASIDADLSAMKVRLGLAQMGEVTSLIPTKVEGAIGKIIAIEEWIESKGIPLRPALFNEVTIGTGVALASTALNFVKTAPFRALGLGAVAGGAFAGAREYGALQRDYLTHLREREAGDTFGESMKRRNFFEKYLVNQRSAEEMIGKIQSSLYEADGSMKATLTDDELRMSMATITDITARKAVSESPAMHKAFTEDRRIGLIRFSERESIETQRTALDVTSHKALTDIETYLSTHAEQATDVLGGTTLEDFMVKLTTNQTTVLKDGAQTLANMAEDPIRNVLGLVAEHAPEITLLKRRFPLGSRALPPEQQILGMDAILDQFTRDARVEAIKYGIKAGAIGAGVGAVIHGIGDVLQHAPDAIQNATDKIQTEISDKTNPHYFVLPREGVTNPTTHVELSPPQVDHTVTIGNTVYQLPPEISITPHDITTGNEGNVTERVYNATIDVPNGSDIIIGKEMHENFLKSYLKSMGLAFTDGHTIENTGVSDNVAIDTIKNPDDTPFMALVPEGYSITHSAGQNAWNLLDNNNNPLAKFVIDEHGKIIDPEKLHNALATHGLDFKNPESFKEVINDATEDGVKKAAESSAIFPPPSTDSPIITGDALKDGGMWDYFLSKSEGPNGLAAANGMKNLFRLYANEHPHEAITFPEGSSHQNYFDNPDHLRTAHFGTEQVQEINIARIPSDAEIHLPNELFGSDAIHEFNVLNDAAIKRYSEEIAKGASPKEAINGMYENKLDDTEKLYGIVLKLGYLGQDDKMPTSPEDMALLFKHMHVSIPETATPQPVADASPVIEKISNGHALEFFRTSNETTPATLAFIDPTQKGIDVQYVTKSEFNTVPEIVKPTFSNDIINGSIDESARAAMRSATENLASNLPWIPVFLPFRSSLEREYIAPAEIVVTPTTNEFLSPYGNEQMYLTRDEIEKRKSPRLSENPEAQLQTQEEINWYLSSLNEKDTQTVADLMAQHETPMAQEVTRVIAIPTFSANASSLYQTLTNYTTQVNANGEALDPKQTEIVILNRASSAEDSMKTEIDRFKTDHPECSVVFLTKDYGDTVTVGQQKRDLTNTILARMKARGETGGDAIIINTFADNGEISNTYLSTISTVLENPMTDMVNGSFKAPKEAYTQFPLLFAPMRLQELFDGMVRHGESNNIPNIISGNTAVRASTLAAVGGYNEKATMVEDRELGHLIKSARNNRIETIVENADLIQTYDPKPSLLANLHAQGIVDESDNGKTWQELATKITEAMPKDYLDQSVNALYNLSYPTLKTTNPKAFDAYFQKSMDALELPYEIVDGTVHITDDSKLTSTMASEINIEEFTKNAAEDVKTNLQTPLRPAEPDSAGHIEATNNEITSNEPLTPRETLENVAGTTDEQITINQLEKQTEQETIANAPVVETTISSPEINQPEPEQVLQTASTETLPTEIETPPVITNEQLPEGISDRINYVIEKHKKEGQAEVRVTPRELMDYIKSSVSIPNGRITDGSMSIQDDKVRVTDVTVQTPLGKAIVSADLVDDPSQGLHLDPDSLETHLDFLLRTQGEKVKEAAQNLTATMKEHFNEKITDPNWESGVMHVTGDKITVTLIKKTTT